MPGRDVAEHLVDQLLQPRLNVVKLQMGREDARAAVDVEADTAGRDYSVFRAHRSDAPDREPVAGMDVRHRHRVLHDAGERGDIGDLIERLVVRHLRRSTRRSRGRGRARASTACSLAAGPSATRRRAVGRRATSRGNGDATPFAIGLACLAVIGGASLISKEGRVRLRACRQGDIRLLGLPASSFRGHRGLSTPARPGASIRPSVTAYAACAGEISANRPLVHETFRPDGASCSGVG